MIAFVFPGQGAQYAGMGAELARAYPEARTVFERADAILGMSLSALCWEGPDERLKETEVTQPAILTTSIAALAILQTRGLRCSMTAGLSLGEYTALVAAAAMRLEDALPLVRQRGRFMQEASSGRRTAMAAILGLDSGTVADICARAGAKGVLEPANYNSPGQIVIAGDHAAVQEGIVLAKAAGAKRAVLLPVSAPFHTSLMEPAAERLAALLARLPLREPEVPVVSNVTAQPTQSPEEIRRLLIAQVLSPVRWEESVRAMSDMGAQTFVEIGPGSTLSGLIRKTVPHARVLRVEDPTTLGETLGQLGVQAEAHGPA
ncbi:MAG: [acyl-carrier-protein] S-malonyltransferase [Armatimonadetes bacterium RBG_19FT_COMBO_69_19]|nr:MAG: [acyl-carrier-protein] S-malonyltransferase [Armatimonadetes bacterium RBG_19FT_COMBO_69_19]